MTENGTKKVRIGIIGIGNMGSAHCKSVYTTENAELTAVCDIDEKKFANIPEEVKDKVCKYTSPEVFFAQAPVDAVIISVPHYDHVPLAMQALHAGKHILVEKPVAPAVGDGSFRVDGRSGICPWSALWRPDRTHRSASPL